MSRYILGSAACLCLASAAGAAVPEPPPRGAPSLPGPSAQPPAGEAPIELDGLTLEGQTRAPRLEREAPASQLEALVLFSAADGLGVGGQLRSGMLGVRGTVAYQPLLFLVDADPADRTFGAFEFSNSVQLNLDTLVVAPGSGRGASLGWRYNDLLGHGVAVAYQSRARVWGQRFDLSFPISYYPAASSRVRDRFGIASDYEINFPFGAGLQFGFGAAWVL